MLVFYINDSFQDGDTFNKKTVLHLQILGRPKVQKDEPQEPLRQYFALQQAYPSLRGRFGRENFHSGVKDLQANKTLWTTRAMHGAEYERGNFEASVVRATLGSSLVHGKVEIEVDLVAEKRVSEYSDRKQPSAYEQLLKKGVKDPVQTTKVSVGLIAPRHKFDAAVDMLRTLAQTPKDVITHRGHDFQTAVADMVYPDQASSPNVGWFDVNEGIFFSIDDKMFEDVSTYMASTPIEKAKLPTFRGPRKRNWVVPGMSHSN